MSLAGSHPFEKEARNPPRNCPRCSCELHGDNLCEVCGAADFHGAGLWICFTCGERNGPQEERCGRCGKNHVIPCPACSYEGFHRDLRCESCGAARALYPAIRRALAETERRLPRVPGRGRAIAVSIALVLVAFSVASSLAVTGKRSEAVVAAGAGGAGVLIATLLGRRRGETGPGMN